VRVPKLEVDILSRMGSDRYHRQYEHLGETLNLEIVRSKRKTLAIHVFPGDRVTEVRAPLKCAWHEINHFIESRLDWLLDASGRLALEPSEPEFKSGAIHSFLGDGYELVVCPGSKRVLLAPGKILLSCRDPESVEQVRSAFHAFLREQSEAVFAERLAHCVENFPLDVQPTRLRIRRMKARWGSCSHKGEICLNSLLVQKPISAIDMVVTHELCHLVHFGHDRNFYSLMDRAMPDWREREVELVKKPQLEDKPDTPHSPVGTVYPEQLQLI
jgi:predicted metal-dependent hydrolase